MLAKPLDIAMPRDKKILADLVKADLEWMLKPNRERITTWPRLEGDGCKFGLPRRVDFSAVVTVFVFEEDGLCEQRESRVKTFDGRRETYTEYKRTRSYAQQWEDLSQFVSSLECGADDNENLWLMEHLPCDCDLT